MNSTVFTFIATNLASYCMTRVYTMEYDEKYTSKTHDSLHNYEIIIMKFTNS